DEKHRQNILKKIGAEEKRYEAVKLIEAGEVALMYNDKMSALESFTSAIALHPEFAPAYGMRGAVYMELNQNEKAYADVQKAIELDPQDAFYYATRGAVTFEGCSKVNPSACEQTLKDMNTAIGLQPNSPELYLMRAGVYLETNRNKEALRDLAKTNELDRTAYWPAASGIAHILMIKGLKDSTNDLQGILALLTESISTVTHSKYYLDVLKPMSEAVNEMREKNASADQAKEILARRSIELPDEKTSMILTDNINFVFALYAERADTYAKLGYHGKAKIDLKTACRIIWKEEFCESKSPASVTD
ncbi:MAG: tetratricopeptide repeat protein, partial [Eubacteriales bacterium]|nr:tetratricopeptide repeat protein [Eubacteriales bacterium]